MNGIRESLMSDGVLVASPIILIEKNRLNYQRQYRKDHSEHLKRYIKAWNIVNKEKLIKYRKENRTKRQEHQRQWRDQNGRAKELDKRKNSVSYRLHNTLSKNLSRSLKTGKGGRKTFDLLGFNVDQLRSHLEKQFESGMSWENYGEWHIDHIIPVKAFNFERTEDFDFKQCWALKNLRPLWAVANISKGAKLDRPFQPSLTI
jgi:HNH endonuclease.